MARSGLAVTASGVAWLGLRLGLFFALGPGLGAERGLSVEVADVVELAEDFRDKGWTFGLCCFLAGLTCEKDGIASMDF